MQVLSLSRIWVLGRSVFLQKKELSLMKCRLCRQPRFRQNNMVPWLICRVHWKRIFVYVTFSHSFSCFYNMLKETGTSHGLLAMKWWDVCRRYISRKRETRNISRTEKAWSSHMCITCKNFSTIKLQGLSLRWKFLPLWKRILRCAT